MQVKQFLIDDPFMPRTARAWALSFHEVLWPEVHRELYAAAMREMGHVLRQYAEPMGGEDGGAARGFAPAGGCSPPSSGSSKSSGSSMCGLGKRAAAVFYLSSATTPPRPLPPPLWEPSAWQHWGAALLVLAAGTSA